MASRLLAAYFICPFPSLSLFHRLLHCFRDFPSYLDSVQTTTFLLFLIFKLVSIEFFTVFHFDGVSFCCILNN